MRPSSPRELVRHLWLLGHPSFTFVEWNGEVISLGDAIDRAEALRGDEKVCIGPDDTIVQVLVPGSS